MYNSHWSNHLPYIVPVWHELNLQTVHADRLVDPNLSLDCGGIGVFKNVVYKQIVPCPYRIDRPSLPYFVNPDRVYNDNIGDCLTFCHKNQTLFSSKCNRIFAHSLDSSQHHHQFSLDESVATSPFHKSIVKNCDYQDGVFHPNKHFVELKVCDGEKQDTELLAIDRESMKLLSYQLEENKFNLELDINLANSPSLFPSTKSPLNFVERNQINLEEYLVGFFRDGHVYRWNVESGSLFIDHDLDLDFTSKVTKFIGLEWAVDLNPFLYFFASEASIRMGDTRIASDPSKSPLVLADYGKMNTFYKNEILHAFTTCQLEPHQLIVSSDFKITFLDIRYPNVNMFSTKHMFCWNDSCQIRRSKVDERKLLLLSSNRTECCLNTFEIGPELQPKQQHLPFHLNLPHDIDAVHPICDCGERYFFRGIELLTYPDEQTDIFSVAYLLNNGDVFVQDLKLESSVERDDPDDPADLIEHKYQNDVGKKVYINRDIDETSLLYLECIKSYIDRSLLKKTSQYDEWSVHCEQCKKCKNKTEHGFCLCLSDYWLDEEKALLQEDSCDEENEEPERKTKKLRRRPIFRNDSLDLDVVKENWYALKRWPEQNKGIRSICGKLTIKLFDRWVGPPPADVPSTSR